MRTYSSASTLFFSIFPVSLSLLALILLCSCSYADDDTKSFDGMGFSVQYPAKWSLLSASDDLEREKDEGKEGNSQAAGRLELDGPCVRFSINWTRDLGISPETILNQIEKTYDSGEVKVLSSKRREISIKGERIEAEVMSLSYELKGYRSEKRFAVWNSSRSDRLFLASLSSSAGCSTEQEKELQPDNDALFDTLVASFSDSCERELLALGPKSKDDAWTLVLGDLLSSYHYSQAKTLPARIARVQVLHTLSPINGTYQLDSQEIIGVDLPSDAALRAAGVQSLLLQEGYDARLAQRSGEIGVAVKDPSGRWQFVSVNPAKPERSVGVLANDTREALIYDSLEELADENQMDLSGLDLDTGLDASKLMQKDCEPSSYVELVRPSVVNESWKEDLQNVLKSYDYDERYQENVFDCSNTAQICWSVLQGKGYDARLMMSWKGHPLGQHLWVVVRYPYEEGWYVAVETANTDGDMKLMHMGKVVEGERYYRGIMYDSSAQYSRLHPEEGMWLTLKILV